MNNTPDSPAQTPDDRTDQGGNYWDAVYPRNLETFARCFTVIDALAYASEARVSGIVDLGAGGEAILMRADREVRGLLKHCERLNIVPVFLHTVATGVDDLAILNTFQKLDFWPKASAIILNEMLVPLGSDRLTAFDLILRQSCVRAAIAMGAPQLWLPALDRETFMEIERRRQSFGAAAKGNPSQHTSLDPLGPHDRVNTERWLEDVWRELSPISTWLL